MNVLQTYLVYMREPSCRSVGTAYLLEVRNFRNGGRARIFHVGPAVFPHHLVEEYYASQIGISAQKSVVGNPCVAVVVLNEFGIVPRAGNEVIAFDEKLALVVEHTSAALVYIRAGKVGGAAVNYVVGAFGAFAAGSRGAEQIIIAVALVYVRRFGKSAHELRFLRPGITRRPSSVSCIMYMP